MSSFLQVISLKPSHSAESQIAPVAISRVGDFSPTPGARTKASAPANPCAMHQASAAGSPQSAPQLAHQPSRLPLNMGFSTVLVSAAR